MSQGCSCLHKGLNKGGSREGLWVLKSHWLPAAPAAMGGLGGNGVQGGAGVLWLWFWGCHPSSVPL